MVWKRWPERALVRAYLIEEGVDVEAYDEIPERISCSPDAILIEGLKVEEGERLLEMCGAKTGLIVLPRGVKMGCPSNLKALYRPLSPKAILEALKNLFD